MITYFEAHLHCLHCGQDSDAEMYTKLLDAPGTVILHIGEQAEVDEANYEAAFLQLQTRHSGEPFRVLLPWLCGHCQWGGWALVTIAENGLVETIESVPLDRTMLSRAQFITYNLDNYFEHLTGVELYQENDDGGWSLRSNFVALLAAALPEPPGCAPSYEDF